MTTAQTYNAGAQRRNRWRPLVWGAAAGLLLLPAVAMQFADSGVDWTAGDFIAMGIVLAIACGIYEFGAWLSGNTAYRAGFGLATLAGFLTVWVNMAVGMLGEGPINLMFAGVLGIAAVGSLLARFRAQGMVRAMVATATAQLAGAGIGLVMGYELLEVALTACFAVPWLFSAMLFQWAARDEVGAGKAS